MRSLKIRKKFQPVWSFNFQNMLSLPQNSIFTFSLPLWSLSLKSLTLTLLTAATIIKSAYCSRRRQVAQTQFSKLPLICLKYPLILCMLWWVSKKCKFFFLRFRTDLVMDVVMMGEGSDGGASLVLYLSFYLWFSP